MILGQTKCTCGETYIATNCPSCGDPSWSSDFKPFNPLIWVYDLECYPNIFTCDLFHVATATRLLFEISDRKDQSSELYQFLLSLKYTGCKMVGFNNLSYDYPMLHFFMEQGGVSYGQMYEMNQKIIGTPWEQRFNNLVWDSDVYIPQIDLFKIHHFDNQARHTSLKILEFNMRMYSIEDLPYPPGTRLDDGQKDELIKYNDHDVDATVLFYIYSIESIDFREELTKQYNINFTNYNDTKIGKEYFIMRLEESMPGSCWDYSSGRKTPRQTPRSVIAFKDIIFPYIEFKRPEFKRVHDWLLTKTITKTKGVFEFLEVTYDMAISMRPNLIKVYGLDGSPDWLKNCKDEVLNHTDKNSLKFVSGYHKKSGLNCVVDGFVYDFGTGGIHGSVDSTTVVSDDEFIIVDWDVKGYYPSLGVVNKVYPEHLSELFCNIANDIINQRSDYKKGSSKNKTLKLASNGVYGDSNSQYSPFYDPQYTMTITINGQLLLCKLAELLIEIPGLKMIQINTDGLTVKCPRSYDQQMREICKWWETWTCLVLEDVEYKRMFIRDVNNYIGEYPDGKLKRKGAYEYERDWHQNHSAMVVPKCAEAVLIHGADPVEFIYNHGDIFDFMLSAKVGRKEILMHGEDTELQRITRFYVSNQGDTLTKVSPPKEGCKIGQWKRKSGVSDEVYSSVISELYPRRFKYEQGVSFDTLGLPWDARINTKNQSVYKERKDSIISGYLCTPCNDITEADRNNINYQYYIDEVLKLTEPLK